MKSLKKLISVGLMLCVSFSFISSALAMDLKVSLPNIPPLVVSADEGILVDLVKAIDDVYEEGTMSISSYPFKRSMQNLTTGKADIHMPLLLNPRVPAEKLPFTYSSETLFRVMFVLYTNKANKEINLSNLHKFKIETDRAHVDYFDFPTIPSSNQDSSLKKLSVGRIDGFVFAKTTDYSLKKLGLTNIKRQKYGTFDSKIILPKGEKGKKIDRILTKSIQILRKNGTYNKIMGYMISYNSSLN